MRLVVSTAPPGVAPELARTLVEERLAACVNIVSPVRSIYTWQGKIEDDEEAVLLIKTRSETLERLSRRLIELHPYDVPEVISLAISTAEGNPDYLSWIAGSVD